MVQDIRRTFGESMDVRAKNGKNGLLAESMIGKVTEAFGNFIQNFIRRLEEHYFGPPNQNVVKVAWT